VTAARWAQQELLAQQSRTDVRVYAVWFNMYPGDSREKWPSTLLTDLRVVQYWDATRAIGTRYLTNLPAILDRRATETLAPTADALWDAYFIYPPGDLWTDRIPLPVSWGYPIMVTRDQLVVDLEALATQRKQ
jgi:hypothetical protein